MKTKRQIGDTIWVAHYRREEVQDTCPVCYGKKEVVLILGNGEHCILECDYCAKGYGSPRGVVTDWRYVKSAERIAITGIEIDERGETYKCGQWCPDESGCFDSEQQALEYAQKLADVENELQETQAECIKKNAHKNFAWNAGYHLREAKRSGESVAYHERMAKICKERSTINNSRPAGEV